MASVFSRIIAGEIPSYRIAESELAFAFLDIAPLVQGHTLVIPKIEVDLFMELPAGVFLHCQALAHHISVSLHAAYACRRVGMIIAGFEVAHAHIHLLPVNTMDDMSFERPRLHLTASELERDQSRIVQELKTHDFSAFDLKLG
jgi:histidine triad (HIT) family protein